MPFRLARATIISWLRSTAWCSEGSTFIIRHAEKLARLKSKTTGDQPLEFATFANFLLTGCFWSTTWNWSPYRPLWCFADVLLGCTTHTTSLSKYTRVLRSSLGNPYDTSRIGYKRVGDFGDGAHFITLQNFLEERRHRPREPT